MEKRLLVLIFYSLLLLFFFSLKSYQKHFKDDFSFASFFLPKKDVVQEKKEEPLFELPLTTEKLQRGYKIYHEKGECLLCHGAYGEGNPEREGPILAHQYEWYLREQLDLFKEKKRNNPEMYPYLLKLTKEDFDDVAHYVSHLRIVSRQLKEKPIKN